MAAAASEFSIVNFSPEYYFRAHRVGILPTLLHSFPVGIKSGLEPSANRQVLSNIGNCEDNNQQNHRPNNLILRKTHKFPRPKYGISVTEFKKHCNLTSEIVKLLI
ncbi:MAG TPA: hypothetical protein DEA22_00640 [Blastocatellia bacterium]|nr:hypothetical protein [Blastocatellia bacterium]